MAMTLDEVAALARRIESRMIQRFGYYNVKTRDGVRYIASTSDAEHMRRWHASERACAIAKRQARQRVRQLVAGYNITSG